MKIFIGMVEIANNINEFAESLKKNNHEVETLCLVKNHYYDENHYDHSLDTLYKFIKVKYIRHIAFSLILFVYFLYFSFKCEIFIFTWNITFLPFKLDLWILKLLGKKVIIFNCGDDVRYRPIQLKIEKMYGLNSFFEQDPELIREYNKGGISFNKAFFSQRLEELSGAKIISLRSQATFQKNPLIIFRFPVHKLLANPKSPNNKLVIVHAPTNTVFKGTKYVDEVVKNLEKKGFNFEYRKIQSKTNDYLIKNLMAADILIDQPGKWIGRLAAEAMAAGCIVIGGNRKSFIGTVIDSPVIQFETDIEDLERKLTELLSNRKLCEKIMLNSYSFWKKYYSYESFAKYIEEILNKSAEKFYPRSDYKSHLLNCSENKYQKTVIKYLY